jgi:hypothetical protein
VPPPDVPPSMPSYGAPLPPPAASPPEPAPVAGDGAAMR